MPSHHTPHRPRSAQRFGLALPITMEGEEGSTHDISPNGVLLETARAAEVGAHVHLSLEYGASDEPPLACSGEVVRVERHGDNFNIAVRLHRPLFDDRT